VRQIDRYNELNNSKIRAFMNIPRLLPLALVLLASLSTGAWAEKADRNKPMNVESDTLRYDDLKQVSIFTGRVVLTKGTILIRGAQIEVRQDAEGYQYGLVTSEPGKLAFFRQKREGVDEFIEGEGITLEYDGKADTVKFINSALLRRLRGATLADEVTGQVIVYNNSTDVFTVDGGKTQGATGSNSGGRVRAMLTPKPNVEATPATPPAVLKTTPQLKDAPR
jgi:lipopolysaccharide export system protein LptA